MKIPFLFPALAFSLTIGLASCGTGGGMGDAPNKSHMTGDTPGTGSYAKTAFEDADQPYNNQSVGSTSRGTAATGQVVEVDSTEARGNSRWNGGDGSSATSAATSGGATNSRLDRTAGLRARNSLIGSNPKNRSRVGQSLSSGNPERKSEEIFVPN